MSSDSDVSDANELLQELIADIKAQGLAKNPDKIDSEPAPNEKDDTDVAVKMELTENAKQLKLDLPVTAESTAKLKHPKEPKVKIEVPMDKVIFDDKEGLIKNLAKAAGEYKGPEEDDDTASVLEDKGGKAKKHKAVWTDADDDQIQIGQIKRNKKYLGPLGHLQRDKSYKEYLSARFQRIVAQPKWATLDRKPAEVDSDDEELLRTVGFLAKPSGATLSAHHLQAKRMKDLNRASLAEGCITSIQFHPTSTAALVSGGSGIATIYGIDGQKNEKLHSIRFPKFPIKCAKITPCGTKAVFGSNKRFYFCYDLLTAQETRHFLPHEITKLHNFQLSPCGRYMAAAGRFGQLHLFDLNSFELIHTFKQEATVTDICFSADSSLIICSSLSNTVSIFSIRQQRLQHTFIDDGCIMGECLDLSPNQRLLATGSNEGVVNVYDFESVQTKHAPIPVKTILNLTTSINDIKFNHSSELLAFISSRTPDAAKLVHFPSGTVYSNFPGFKSEIGKIRTVEFSPASGYLAMGNADHHVPLFRLKHFKNY